MEIQNSNTQRVINKKGEWGCNLPPGQVTVVRGEIWTQENRPDIGNKRARAGGGEPPIQQTSDSCETDYFSTQFRQGKRRKLEQTRALKDTENLSLNSQMSRIEARQTHNSQSSKTPDKGRGKDQTVSDRRRNRSQPSERITEKSPVHCKAKTRHRSER